MGADDIGAEARAGPQRPIERERFGFSLDRDRLELLEVEDALGRAEGRLRDRNAVDGCGALQAGGGVHDVASDDALAFLGTGAEHHDGLSGIDPHPRLQGEPLVFRVQLLDRLEDSESGANRALGVVLMYGGRSEDGHDGVPDELLDRPSVTLDLLS